MDEQKTKQISILIGLLLTFVIVVLVLYGIP
jgi:hypothetical protein